MQNGKNVKAHVKDIVEQLFLLGVSDFVNVTDKYNQSYINLKEAIDLIPFLSRKKGQVITFVNKEGDWVIYQFKGYNTLQWNNTTLWVNLFESIYINSILPDEEDLTKTDKDEQGNVRLKFKDKVYDPENFSGLGRVYLRKNIMEGKNTLLQEMTFKPNTVYYIQYDYDLNNQEINIPENCVLKFEGGSISNGTIIGDNTSIESPIKKIFNNIQFKGLFTVPITYPEWWGAIGDNVTDDTNAFISNINFSYYNNGVKIQLSNKKYIVSNIDIINKVVLEGNGIGSSIIQQKGNCSDSLISIKKNSTYCMIKNLTINGEASSNTSGITLDSISEFGGDPGISGAWETTQVNPEQDYYTYRNLLLENICVSNFVANGINISPVNYTVFLRKIYCYGNGGIGINNYSYDNIFENLYIESNGLDGIIDYGSNNKWVNIKSIWNGNKAPALNGNPVYYLPAGLAVRGNRCEYINVEVQDNYCNNLFITGNYNQILNIILDTQYVNTNNKETYPYQIWLHNCIKNRIIGKITAASIYQHGPIGYSTSIDKFNNEVYLDYSVPGNVPNNWIIKQNRNGKESSEFICYRDREIDSIGKDKAVLTSNGLEKQNDDTIFFYRNYFNQYYGFTLVLDFIYKSTENDIDLLNNAGINDSWERSIKLALNNTGGISFSIPLNFQYFANGTLFNDFTFKNDVEYRLTLKFYRKNDFELEVYMSISYLDLEANDIVQKTSSKSAIYLDNSVSIAPVTIIGVLDNNNICVYKQLLITHEIIPYDMELYNSILDFKENPIIYFNFCNYIRQIDFSLSKLPNPSSDIDLSKIYNKYGEDYTRKYICNRLDSNRYEWLLLNPKKYEYELPTTDLISGYTTFYSAKNKPIWYVNEKWVDSNGIDINISNQGNYSNKPENPPIGFSYFCTDKQTTEGSRNGIMIYYAGDNTWVDALGRVVS